jgi:hypothetical protein
MAEIQIVYRHYFCDCIELEDEFIDQCLTGAARDYGCKGFSNGGITSDRIRPKAGVIPAALSPI